MEADIVTKAGIPGLKKEMLKRHDPFRFEKLVHKFPTVDEIKDVWKCTVCEGAPSYPFLICTANHMICLNNDCLKNKVKKCPAMVLKRAEGTKPRECDEELMQPQMKWYEHLCDFAVFEYPMDGKPGQEFIVGMEDNKQGPIRSCLKRYKNWSEVEDSEPSQIQSIQGLSPNPLIPPRHVEFLVPEVAVDIGGFESDLPLEKDVNLPERVVVKTAVEFQKATVKSMQKNKSEIELLETTKFRIKGTEEQMSETKSSAAGPDFKDVLLLPKRDTKIQEIELPNETESVSATSRMPEVKLSTPSPRSSTENSERTTEWLLLPDGKLWSKKKIGTRPAKPTPQQICQIEEIKSNLIRPRVPKCGPSVTGNWKLDGIIHPSEISHYESVTSEEEVDISSEEIRHETKVKMRCGEKIAGAVQVVNVPKGHREEPECSSPQDESRKEEPPDIQKNTALLEKPIKLAALALKGATNVDYKGAVIGVAPTINEDAEVEGSSNNIVKDVDYFAYLTHESDANSICRSILPDDKAAKDEGSRLPGAVAENQDLYRSMGRRKSPKKKKRFLFTCEFMVWCKTYFEILSADTEIWVNKLKELYTSKGYDDEEVERALRRLIADLESEQKFENRHRTEAQRYRHRMAVANTLFTSPPTPPEPKL